LFGEDEAFEEASACVFGTACEVCVDAVHRTIELALAEELIRVLKRIPLSPAARSEAEANGQDEHSDAKEPHVILLPIFSGLVAKS
jgi:hypothetical protein